MVNINYTQIIEDLEKAVNDIATQGISITPLNKAIEDLKSHSKNIQALEDNIEAVKAEIINPIKSELEENKRTGKFSIMGFYLGAAGIIVTIIGLLYTTFSAYSQSTSSPCSQSTSFISSSQNTGINTLDSRLDNIESLLTGINYFVYGLNSNYRPTKNEFKLGQFQISEILKNGDNIFSVKSYIPPEIEKNGKWFPMVSLTFFINNKQLGIKGVKENIEIINNSGISDYNQNFNSIQLTENDGFIINGKFQYQIKRIFRTESQILTVCDDIQGVLIKKIE
ncbi:MAG: hypothetical protein PHH62_00120 [Endomicrobiaceae bacterium]|nr:hypothetical protein [Endomicrobiaceae bacterium]